VCGGLQNSMDLGETVPSVCSGTCLTVSADGSEVHDIIGEKVCLAGNLLASQQ